MNVDGSVQVHTGATEIGTGAIVSSLRTVVSEILTVDEAVVTVITGGTDTGPYDHGSQGSRTLYGVGTAAGRAADDLRRLLLEEYARQREVGVDDVVLRDGSAVVAGDADTQISIATLARDLVGCSGPLVTSGRFQPEGPAFEAGCVTGWVGAFNEPTFHCHVADVAVDVVTGHVRVLRIKAIHDVGAVVNPDGAVGQVLGGVMQGVGYALVEEIRTDASARTTNPNFHDYRIPTITDAPGAIEVELVTEYSTSQGYRGLKGVGEAPAIPGAAAIGSAVRAAIGAQPDVLPMTCERVAALADLSAVVSS
jgi:CO/xanthine dehydrogenase Mo-binding subunit